MSSKLLAPAAAFVLAATLSSSAALAQKGPISAASMPSVLAVAFHADWCAGCKALGPKVKEAKKSHCDKNILFVKLDLTNDKTRAQSAYHAAILGIDKAWMESNGKTAQVLLIDTKTKKVLGKLKPKHTQSEIDAALKQALSKAKA